MEASIFYLIKLLRCKGAALRLDQNEDFFLVSSLTVYIHNNMFTVCIFTFELMAQHLILSACGYNRQFM